MAHPSSTFPIALVRRLFQCASLQRWNDQVRPVPFSELDKQAHKMIIAYVLGRFEEDEGYTVCWNTLIEGALFESLHRSVLTDIKPGIYDRMMAEKRDELNRWVLDQLAPEFAGFPDLYERFSAYLLKDEGASLEQRLLKAGHTLATRWEFQIIEATSPVAYNTGEVHQDLVKKMTCHAGLAGMRHLEKGAPMTLFVDLCGQLRFQKRWAQSPRIPETSVLGHMFFVSMLTYFSLLLLDACPRRCYNGVFTALFHDLPEVLTRDIASPVKTSVSGLDDLIKACEHQLIEEQLIPLLPSSWHTEIRGFIENEFRNRVTLGNGEMCEVSAPDLSVKYNEDRFDPRDGELIKACDHLAAFIEATASLRHGVTSSALEEGIGYLRTRYRQCVFAGLDLGAVFQELDNDRSC